MNDRLFKGVAASAGTAVGPVVFLSRKSALPSSQSELGSEAEWQRYLAACEIFRQRLAGNVGCDSQSLSEETQSIFEGYGVIAQDPMLRNAVKERLATENCTAEWAVFRAFQTAIDMMAKLPNNHIAEKRDDIEGVRDLLLGAFAGAQAPGTTDFSGAIVLSARLTPRDLLELARSGVAGVVSEAGTGLSHAAILARNLGVPAVFGVGECRSQIAAGELAVVDGNRGIFEVAPSAAHLAVYRVRDAAWMHYGDEVLERSRLPVVTTDGIALEIHGNIESHREMAELLTRGASGVGLFRLEFFYLAKQHLPSEEEIFAEISSIAEDLSGADLVVRLLDAGGDKEIPALRVHPDREGRNQNSVMGLRGIRLLLRNPLILHAQVRAIVRAQLEHGNVSLLVPFVSCVEEVWAVRAILREEWHSLAGEKALACRPPRLGMMVELPAAVAAVDLFAHEVDFFSVGTNDLTQHLLAVDRSDESVSTLYDCFHPGIIRCLRKVFREASSASIPVTLCGEMASDPLSLELLVGLGLRRFSVNARSLPFVKDILRETSLSEAEGLATEVQLLGTASDVRARLQARFIERFGLERYAMVCGS